MCGRAKLKLKLFLSFLIFIASVNSVKAQPPRSKRPPPTKIDAVKETIHGTVVSDPYRWLEDQASPETRAWIDAQNACTQAALGKLPGQDAKEQRLGHVIKVDTLRPPIEPGR